MIVQRTAVHTAYLDPYMGMGLLVLPSSVDDVPNPQGGRSLNGTDWNQMMTWLIPKGWEPLAEDDGALVHVGFTSDFHEVVALTMEGAPRVSIEELSIAHRALCDEVGVVVD